MYVCSKCGKEIEYYDCWRSDKPLCHSCADKAFDYDNNAPLRTFLGGFFLALIIIAMMIVGGEVSEMQADIADHPEKYQVTEESAAVPSAIPDGSPVTLLENESYNE